MHVENMLAVAAVIEKCEPRPNIHAWSMEVYIQDAPDNCGTAGCVATWTVAILEPATFARIERLRKKGGLSELAEAALAVNRQARRILDLRDFAAGFLFNGGWLSCGYPLRYVQSAQVAAIMRNMVTAYQDGELHAFVAEHKPYQ